ncbi:MAG: response regulator [Candidatus Pacebacteria bacterium]|nr:response regulator [Candidatus Paceibacterota bacterium]
MANDNPLILCIDDDADFTDSVRLVLENNGYAMEEAGSAEEGLRIYKKRKPDAILVDLMMEEVDAGVNFVKEVRALGAAPPVFMLSSVGDDLAASTDYTALGLDGVLQKPVSPERLLKTLGRKVKATRGEADKNRV